MGTVLFVSLCISAAEALVPMPGEKAPVYPSSLTVKRSAAQDYLGPLFRWYGQTSQEKSIHRCPFLISCSVYARRAIQEKGFLWGTVLFIDRYFYRENQEAYKHYLRVERKGRILLDDSSFLNGESQ